MKASDKWSPGLSLPTNKFTRVTNTQSDYFLVSECRVQLDIFGSWKNSHSGSLTCKRTYFLLVRANRKSQMENFSPKVINGTTQYLIASRTGYLLKISRMLELWV